MKTACGAQLICSQSTFLYDTAKSNSKNKDTDPLVCTIEILKNSFDDFLPIIPTGSTVKDNKVLYRLELEATLTKDGKPAADHALNISSERKSDQIISVGQTDSHGKLKFRLETRESGEAKLKTTPDITLTDFSVNIDNFLGAGKDVVTQWIHGGVNGTRCRVKYLGP